MRHRYTLFSFTLSSIFFFSVENIIAQTPPVSLRPDVQVQFVTHVPSYCSRIEIDPITGTIFYAELAGNIHRLLAPGGVIKDTILYTTANHHVTNLYGMAFHDSSLFLVGNEPISTSGKFGLVMRGKLKPNGTRTWDTVAITQIYPAGNTTFDHGFGGIAVTPAGDSLIICSGSRSDHGEVESNNGLYPGLREVPLTSAAFRIPIAAKNLVLPADSAALSPYLFADGLRNTFDLAYAPNGDLFGCENSGERDDPEEINWLRKGRHYGFPWVMGGDYNPQQYPGYNPDNDVMLNKNRFGYKHGFFYDDPTFPPLPANLVITPGVNNFGPDADYFRNPTTGIVMQAGDLGISMNSVTAHRSPLGLVFDLKNILIEEFKGDGFMVSYQESGDSAGNTATGMTGTMLDPGQDLVHLDLQKNAAGDNYDLHATTIVTGFSKPVDACILNNIIYVLEYSKNDNDVSIWKITLPVDTLEIETSHLSSNNLCPGQTISVAYAASGLFNNNNVFTAQLSNKAGKFIAPTAIGTNTAVSSGAITAIIPPSTVAGTKYRIRVVSSSPVVTGSNNGENISIKCAAPTGLSTTNISSTSAKLNWMAQSCAVSYQVKYHVVGAASWKNANVTVNSKTLNGLLPSTDYEWKVRTKCVASPSIFSAYSPIINFTTNAAKEFLSTTSEQHEEAVLVYPNPFSTSATVEFFLNKESRVKTTLWDVQGRKIQILDEGTYDPGMHQIIFTIPEISPGIYFLQIENEEISTIKKLIVQSYIR